MQVSATNYDFDVVTGLPLWVNAPEVRVPELEKPVHASHYQEHGKLKWCTCIYHRLQRRTEERALRSIEELDPNL